MTKYARDEFDRVPETATRQGVHRAVAQARRRSLAPILVVGCLALAIGLVAFLFLPKLGFSSAGQASALSASESASAEPTATPTATEPGPTAEPTPSAAAEPSESAAAIDKTQPVAVYNGTLTPGLATRAGGTVTADGWIVGETGNWGGVPRTTSVIFYSDEAQQPNAEALGTLLGIEALVESAEFPTPLVVVLGPDYR